ncbi:MAG: helix-turn-helix domain-containing protein [Streptococcus sp.]
MSLENGFSRIEKKGLSQEQLASRLNISRQALSNESDINVTILIRLWM